MNQAVAGILIHDGKVLIGKKIVKENHFLSGGWHIPGGHILENESEQQALIREFKEETNIEVEIVNKICSHQIDQNKVLVHWYILKAFVIEPTAGDDLEEILFVDINKVYDSCDDRAKSLWPQPVVEYFIDQ